MSARNSQKKINPKKCINCQKRNLSRLTVRLCATCFEFVDIETQAGIVKSYRPGQDFDLKLSSEFSAFMGDAIAQAAIGTLAKRPLIPNFKDMNGSPVRPQLTVWVETNSGKLRASVLGLNTQTGKVRVKMMSHPPDVIEVQSKDLEVIQDEQQDEHPEN